MAKTRRFSSLGLLSAAAALFAGPAIVSAPSAPSAPVAQEAGAAKASTSNERVPQPRATTMRITRVADLGGGFVRSVQRWEPIWVGRPRPRRMLHTRFARG